MIRHNEMLKEMNSGAPFDITFISFDKKRKTGGQLVTFQQAVKHQAGRVDVLKPKGEPSADSPQPQHRAPNHDIHGTVNIKCRDGSIRKVRTRLIVKFNHQEVVL